jgi:hypothetical protein
MNGAGRLTREIDEGLLGGVAAWESGYRRKYFLTLAVDQEGACHEPNDVSARLENVVA